MKLYKYIHLTNDQPSLFQGHSFHLNLSMSEIQCVSLELILKKKQTASLDAQKTKDKPSER